MSTGQHRRAVKVGEQYSQALKQLTDTLGSRRNPGGSVTYLYARYASMFRNAKNYAEVSRLFMMMRQELVFILDQVTAAMTMLGNSLADELYDIYELESKKHKLQAKALVGALAVFDAQRKKVLMGMKLGSDPAILFGSSSRVGVLSPGAVTRNVAHVAPLLFSYIIDSRTLDKEKYFKQAVAALDFRTTMCCILVHGQVQEWNQSFNLIGTPRYADRIKFPPFHLWCRTVVVLVHEEDIEDDVTRRMRSEAGTYIPSSPRTRR